MNGALTAAPVHCAIWARVSTADQHTENQLGVLREWAAKRGLIVTAEFITEDSAWQSGTGKGAEFDSARKALLAGSHKGDYSVVLVWAIDRLSRKGIEDTLSVMRQLYDTDSDVWAYQQPWLVTSEPRMRELLVSFFAWMAEQESALRSARIKTALAAKRARGEQVGGRKAGSRDKKPRSKAGYQQRWAAQRDASTADTHTGSAEANAQPSTPLPEVARDVPSHPVAKAESAAASSEPRKQRRKMGNTNRRTVRAAPVQAGMRVAFVAENKSDQA